MKDNFKETIKMHHDGYSPDEIVDQLGTSLATTYRYLKQHQLSLSVAGQHDVLTSYNEVVDEVNDLDLPEDKDPYEKEDAYLEEESFEEPEDVYDEEEEYIIDHTEYVNLNYHDTPSNSAETQDANLIELDESRTNRKAQIEALRSFRALLMRVQKSEQITEDEIDEILYQIEDAFEFDQDEINQSSSTNILRCLKNELGSKNPLFQPLINSGMKVHDLTDNSFVSADFHHLKIQTRITQLARALDGDNGNFLYPENIERLRRMVDLVLETIEESDGNTYDDLSAVMFDIRVALDQMRKGIDSEWFTASKQLWVEQDVFDQLKEFVI